MQIDDQALRDYRAAMDRYRKACSEYQRVLRAYKAVERSGETSVLQDTIYFQALKKYKAECRVYADARTVWQLSHVTEKEIGKVLEFKKADLSALAQQMENASGNTLFEEEKKYAFSQSEDFKVIAEAARSRATTSSIEQAEATGVVKDMEVPFEN